MKNKNLLIYCCLTVSLLTLGVTVFQWWNAPNIGYVNLSKLYDEFQLKKELEGKLTTLQDSRKQIMDSLVLTLNVMSASIQNGTADEELKREFEVKRTEYLTKDKAFSEDNANMMGQFDEQVWEQLNQYVTEYGNEHNLTVMIGGDGSGAVMYAKDRLDVTDDLITFSNNRYQGK